jgi:capsular exopolysaccharide synthesis family protein
VNSVVDAYVTYQANQKRSTAAEVLRILQKEKVARDAELADYLEKMLKFKRENAALSFNTAEGNIITQRLSILSQALTDAQLQVIEAKAASAGAQAVKDDPAKLRMLMPAEFLDSSTGDDSSGRLYYQLEQLQLERARYGDQSLGSEHPRIRELDAQISRLNALADERFQANQHGIVDLFLGRLAQDLQKATYREQELQKAFEEQQTSALDLNVKNAEYAMLESGLRRTERLCEILDNRIKEVNVTEDVGALNINILEVATPEKDPVWPHRPRIMLMALAIGMLLGVGGGLLQDLLDQRLRSADDIQATLGVPVLGIVPHMTDGPALPERGQKVHHDPMSDIAEAYRTVRTAVYFGVPDNKAKRMLVTSPAPGDGKSTSVSNLGIAMAAAGQRTLILDADFRRPTQHKIFEVDDEVGLSSVIAGRAELETAIKQTGVKNLSVMPCGPIPPNPSELLNSQSCAALLDRLSAEFDQILIDSPPVMAVADARILAASCDLTVMVLRAGKSTRKASGHALESLLGIGASVLGVIVNDVPRGRDRYGYYAAYGYYGYGENGNRKRRAIGGGEVADVDPDDRAMTVARKV